MGFSNIPSNVLQILKASKKSNLIFVESTKQLVQSAQIFNPNFHFNLASNYLCTMKKVGIIGGGQLGMMTIEAANKNVPAHFVVLESAKDCPAGHLTQVFIPGSLNSDANIRELALASDILTWEIEHINVDTLIALQTEGKPVVPNPHVLKIIQNKGQQKRHYTLHNLPTAPYQILHHSQVTPQTLQEFPGENIVVKTCTGGYDGKGVAITTKSELLSNPPFEGEILLESFIENSLEIAIIVAIDTHGNHAVYPAIEMYFNPTSNLVEFLFSPARIQPTVEEKAKKIALKAVESLNSPGLFAVELFLTPNQLYFQSHTYHHDAHASNTDFANTSADYLDILVNEIAPRPHNSGHHTIEGCHTSQFEQFLRILTDKPLGDPGLKQPAAMINIVGPTDFSGKYQLKHLQTLQNRSDVFIHMYGKSESKPNRKLGHATIIAPTLDVLLKNANELMPLLAIEKA